ncbi:hydrogenase nickel incorporation protein HypB [Campylobacter mucosalis]|uniref:hydrogenase nickel incorporation protein HypB n=1 Tax=Campylobacter mucosalis TaxID=202 RepID=UPI0004D3AEFB|nr:hydrogenase nickel incorporation protein HypB [Campylobacter mucosalis]KEA46533.1 hydrogenase [Campylobacter mucosalis]QKF62968.1 hydrogenase nickel insertion protein HypB [Campylobacter mucosalis]
MCKDCGCSVSGWHTHADGTSHSHTHSHPTLNDSKTIDVITKILSVNDEQALKNRAELEKRKILGINLMSSPGAGKTTLLEATIKGGKFKIGVVEGDLETNADADRIAKAGAPAFQISTGQTCHLDAFMVNHGILHIPLDTLELLFVENVGNLVCPASYDIGTHINVVLLSVPEGDDKVAKYPVMFKNANLVVVTKATLLEHFEFDIDKVKREARKLNPNVDVIVLDSKSGEGLDAWFSFLEFKRKAL